ncbi:guanine nucleotide-binding protein subunit beta-like protein 1 [Chelonus insularis]|uniref:guanine nucleotide-binding protein subunit beta-like protein 1 n=1 Tax=Chelonus insularis TaxID=460826 RepID=UPI001588BC5D|nr:guanine nucleotide-binding protein subunit beta-like protein 1 [Chelonus insularis]
MAILPPDPIYILRGSMGPVHGLLFRISPYIEHLYAGAETGNIHIWDLKKHREVYKLETIKEQCLSLHTFDDEYLIIQRKDRSLDVWRPNGSTWTFDKSINTDFCGFCKCQILNNDILLIPLPNSCVGALSLKTQKVIYNLDPTQLSETKPLGEVMAIKCCGDENNIVLVAYESGAIALWDVKEKAAISWLNTESCPMALTFDKYWMRGIVGNPTDKMEVFELNRKNQLIHKTSITLKNSGISALASRLDSKVFASGGWDGRVRVFSWKTLRPLAVLDQHRSTIFDIIYSSEKVQAWNNKTLMAATGKDGTVSLWDLYNQ